MLSNDIGYLFSYFQRLFYDIFIKRKNKYVIEHNKYCFRTRFVLLKNRNYV
ncbi:hypothetical protein BFAG_00221 [Bacteroides fragilis 3_1_12]|uniref:Uncharacterized protein n=1 Tax=Bacteroides fragilis 3_1_12 TaxID=457424 RepID=A0ABN0BFM9_BACFG|nr:hypothetical protein BFAG_00221 [Bacteroides fragilis 3_1_12]